MAIIELKRVSGTKYQVKVRDREGKWFPTLTFDKKQDALKKEAEYLEFRDHGKLANSGEGRAVTFQEYWEVYAENNRDRVSPGWKKSQDQMVRDYVLPVIGQMKMADIGKADIGQVLHRMEAMGKARATQSAVYAVMKTAFGFAVDYYEMLGRSPVNARMHKPKAHEVERSFYEPARLLWFLEQVRGHYLGPAIWLQALTGMRVGEAQFLKGRHLDFENQQILIEGTFNNKVSSLQDYPKGKKATYVPMVEPLADYLAALSRRRDEFVCQADPESRGANFRPGSAVTPGAMLPYETYLSGLKRLCRFHGLPEITTHELRHSCSELWVSMGATQEDVRRLLNQKDVSTTARYIHRTDGRLKKIGERLTLRKEPEGEAEGPEFQKMFHVWNKVTNLQLKTGGSMSG